MSVRLTDREREVVRRLVKGQRYKVIAQDLGVTVTTVASVVSRIAARLPGDAPPARKVVAWATRRPGRLS